MSSEVLQQACVCSMQNEANSFFGATRLVCMRRE